MVSFGNPQSVGHDLKTEPFGRIFIPMNWAGSEDSKRDWLNKQTAITQSCPVLCCWTFGRLTQWNNQASSCTMLRCLSICEGFRLRPSLSNLDELLERSRPPDTRPEEEAEVWWVAWFAHASGCQLNRWWYQSGDHQKQGSALPASGGCWGEAPLATSRHALRLIVCYIISLLSCKYTSDFTLAVIVQHRHFKLGRTVQFDSLQGLTATRHQDGSRICFDEIAASESHLNSTSFTRLEEIKDVPLQWHLFLSCSQITQITQIAVARRVKHAD